MTLGSRIVEARQRRGLSQRAIAERFGISRAAVAQWESDATRPGASRLVALASLLQVSVGWLVAGEGDAPTAGAPSPAETPSPAEMPSRAAPPLRDVQPAGAELIGPELIGPEFIGPRDLPVYASAQGGPDGMTISYEPIEWVRRPAPLAQVKDGFAVYVVNDSMEPKFKHGDMILVHPTRPPRPGDYVLVVLDAEDGAHSALVKRLVKLEPETVRLAQFNPPLEFTIKRPRVTGLHTIVGSYEGR